MKKPRLQLLWEAIRGFLPHTLVSARSHSPWACWFHPRFARRHGEVLFERPFRIKPFGPLPSFQDNLDALDGLRRLVASVSHSPQLVREIRYPYLDQTLLEFLYSIPREQIVGIGQRRSLMRRALGGVVPVEILNRRQKAPTRPRPVKEGCGEWASVLASGQYVVSNSIGIIDVAQILGSLQRPGNKHELFEFFLSRTMTLESWLRHVTCQGVLKNSTSIGQ
jgi:hypothetical protein